MSHAVSRPALVVAVLLSLAGTAAEARQYYCYAEVIGGGDKVTREIGADTTLYVSPIFKSSASAIALEARYGGVAPGAGLATCISDRDQPDLAADRQQMIDGANGDGEPVEIKPLPP